MLNNQVPISNWDGQLPAHIYENEKIWWEVLPAFMVDTQLKILQFFGGAKEPPSRATIGKVICVADTRADLRNWFGTSGGSLLNHRNCFCSSILDERDVVYMAGRETKPDLTFKIPGLSILSIVSLRFGGRIDPDMTDAVQTMEHTLIPSSHESAVSVVTFKHGNWENGLDTAFKAAIWVRSDREEALKSIWGISLS